MTAATWGDATGEETGLRSHRESAASADGPFTATAHWKSALQEGHLGHTTRYPSIAGSLRYVWYSNIFMLEFIVPLYNDKMSSLGWTWVPKTLGHRQMWEGSLTPGLERSGRKGRIGRWDSWVEHIVAWESAFLPLPSKVGLVCGKLRQRFTFALFSNMLFHFLFPSPEDIPSICTSSLNECAF